MRRLDFPMDPQATGTALLIWRASTGTFAGWVTGQNGPQVKRSAHDSSICARPRKGWDCYENAPGGMVQFRADGRYGGRSHDARSGAAMAGTGGALRRCGAG